MTREYVNVDTAGNLYVWAWEARYTALTLESACCTLVGGPQHAIEEGVDIGGDMR